MKWTDEEVRRLFELKAQGLSWRQIGVALNRNYHSVNSKWVDMHRNRSHPNTHDAAVPKHVIAEREHRLNAPLTITAFVFGDPPIGFSALEGRR